MIATATHTAPLKGPHVLPFRPARPDVDPAVADALAACLARADEAAEAMRALRSAFNALAAAGLDPGSVASDALATAGSGLHAGAIAAYGSAAMGLSAAESCSWSLRNARRAIGGGPC